LGASESQFDRKGRFEDGFGNETRWGSSNCRRMSKLLVTLASLAILARLGGASAQPAAGPAANPAKAITLDTDPHLVGWWKFEEASGNSAADASRGGHPATLEGGGSFDTRSAAGRDGKAIRFEGKNDSLKVPGFKGVTGSRPRTISAWIKTPEASGEIVAWGTDDYGQMWVLGHIRARVGVTPKGGYLYMREATNDDAWHHVAVVVQAAAPPNLHDHVKLFKDGELAEIDDIGLLDLWPIQTGDQLEVRIGRGFKGLIDDLRIYNRALSGDEIRALFRLEGNRPLTKP